MITPIRTELTVTDNVPFGQPVSSQRGLHRFYALTLERPAWKNWQPGQFIMLRPLSVVHVAFAFLILFVFSSIQ